MGNFFLIFFSPKSALFFVKNTPKQAEPDPVTLEKRHLFNFLSSIKTFLIVGNLDNTIFSNEFCSLIKFLIIFFFVPFS